jgi:hypothetical protein
LPHVFSRENNLEWAFRTDDLLHDRGGRQMAVLAQAAARLPGQWPSQPTEAEQQMITMLGLVESSNEAAFVQDGASWQDEARHDVLNCRPPIHELSERSHGLSLLRWLLHRIFPYPCFLFDEQQLCARLRVDALAGGEATGQALVDILKPYSYVGALAGFSGSRWWRSGIEDWLFNETSGQSGSPSAVAELALRHGATRHRTWLRPVIVLNGDLARDPELAEVDQTVRVRPDDWPVFADDAFALKKAATEDPTLLALVEPNDRALLGHASVVDDES